MPFGERRPRLPTAATCVTPVLELEVSVSSDKPNISDVLFTPGKAPLDVVLALLVEVLVFEMGCFGRFAVECAEAILTPSSSPRPVATFRVGRFTLVSLSGFFLLL